MQEIRPYDDLSDGRFISQFILAQVGLIPTSGWLRSSFFIKKFIKNNLPYALHPTDRGDYIVLNREYKPLGWPCAQEAFIDYNDPFWLPFCFVPAASEPVGCGFHYLYSGDDTPWSGTDGMLDYLDRVQALFGLSNLRSLVWRM